MRHFNENNMNVPEKTNIKKLLASDNNLNEIRAKIIETELIIVAILEKMMNVVKSILLKMDDFFTPKISGMKYYKYLSGYSCDTRS